MAIAAQQSWVLPLCWPEFWRSRRGRTDPTRRSSLSRPRPRVWSRPVELTEAAWGTQIALDVDGLGAEADDVYWLWLSVSDGDRVAAGTFRGDGHMQMSAALPLDARRSRVGHRCR